MAVNKRLIGAGATAAAGGLTPSEHFGVVLYEGDGSSSHSINGGKFGAGAYFNGSSSKVDIGTLGTTFENNFSFSLWFNLSTIPSSGIVTLFTTFEDYYCYAFIRDSDKKVEVRVENASTGYVIKSTSTFGTYGVWHHLAVTKSSSDGLKIYINGSLENTDATATVDLKTMNGDNLIGAYNAAGTTQYYLEGKIDQVRIFTKALSSSEVSTLYAETASTVESLDPLSEDTTDTLQVLGDSSCLATYQFENDETDLSGNYDLTGNEIQYAAGRYGQAASFNGSSSYAQITSSPPQDNSGVMSVSFWAKTTSTSRAVFFIAEAPNPNKEFLKLENYGYQGTNSFRVSYDNNMLANIDNEAISDGNWHHIVITAGSGNVKTYKDNSLLATQSVTITDRTLDAFAIGYRKYNNDLYFDGEIDQFRIFNKELSASEVTTLYNENSLVASYRFEGNANDDMRAYDGTASNVTYEYGLGFQPDLVWIKPRSFADNHALADSTRGTGKVIVSNTTSAENNLGLASFDSGGFTLANPNWNNINSDGHDFVAWCWKANGGTTTSATTTEATNGTYQANVDAGFSIVTFTTSNSTAQPPPLNYCEHGLGVAPSIVMYKETSDSGNWMVNVPFISNNGALHLNLTDAMSSGFAYDFFDSDSTNIAIRSNYAISRNESLVAYVFAEVDGFSKFGSYTGTSADGNIIETGFEPAFIIIKKTSAASGSWWMLDNRRNPTNPRNTRLVADQNFADSTGTNGNVNFFSNGFELLGNYQGTNESGQTYIYMAFAADPDTETPTVAKSFSTVTYTGTGSDPLVIDGLGFKPGLVWIKTRDQAREHILSDIVRGPDKEISTSDSSAEEARGVKSFDDDGFTLDNATFNYNNNGEDYVAWAFKADDNEPTIDGGSALAVYKFEDNANDVTGNNNGTAYNVTYTSSGKFNKAASFNGSNSYVDTGSQLLQNNKAFTFSLWIKFSTSQTGKTFISRHNDATGGASIGIDDSDANKIKFHLNSYSTQRVNGTTALNDGNWHHIVGTWDTKNLKLYVDGSLDASSTPASTSLTFPSLNMRIGSWSGNTSLQYFEGDIDQVRIYSGAVSDIGVAALYAETASDNDDTLLGGPPETIISANANAGFSIVKYEGTGSNTSYPHGLSAAPELVITKILDNVGNWTVGQFAALGTDGYLKLNTSDSKITATNVWNDTAPTSTVVNIGTSSATNTSGSEYISYCFHSVSGFSDIGSYSGNSTSGRLINIGFQPDWVMIKTTNATSNWFIIDSVRGGLNDLRPNSTNAEETRTNGLTFVSNGFEIDDTTVGFNNTGTNYIYMAFKIN